MEARILGTQLPVMHRAAQVRACGLQSEVTNMAGVYIRHLNITTNGLKVGDRWLEEQESFLGWLAGLVMSELLAGRSPDGRNGG